MRPLILTAAATLFVACTEGDDTGQNEGTDNGETVTQAPPELDDTGWPAGDLAGFFMDLGTGFNPPTLSAVFTESSPGFVNLAQCGANPNKPCLTTFPQDEDEFEDVTTDREIERETINTRFLGFDIRFAGYSIPYREDAETGFGFYNRKLTEEEPTPLGWVGAGWEESQWPAWTGEDLLYVSDVIELVSPRPGENISFHDGQKVPIEWVPTGEGEITLQVNSDLAGITRMYLLNDDGYFELDVDSLGLGGALSEDLDFTLQRWNRERVQKFGHVIDFVATSRASFTGEFFQTGGREFLRASDQCAEATGLPPIQAGGYWGFLGDFGADINVGDTEPSSRTDNSVGCLPPWGGECAGGSDALYKVEVPPRHLLQVEYNVYDDNGVFYFLSNCDNRYSCFLGADFDPMENVPEFLNFFNTTDSLRRFYLVADSQGTQSGRICYASQPIASYYTLDVKLDPLSEPDMYDSCEDAEDEQAIFPGNYYAENTAYTNDLNPGIGGCTGSSTPGPDAMVPIDVNAGQSIQVNVNMPGGNPAIYFVYQCDDAFSCPAGCDASIDEKELCSYTNQSAVDERIYAVIDSEDGILPYFLSIQ